MRENAPLSPIIATHTSPKGLKPFICHTYKKGGGGGRGIMVNKSRRGVRWVAPGLNGTSQNFLVTGLECRGPRSEPARRDRHAAESWRNRAPRVQVLRRRTRGPLGTAMVSELCGRNGNATRTTSIAARSARHRVAHGQQEGRPQRSAADRHRHFAVRP